MFNFGIDGIEGFAKAMLSHSVLESAFGEIVVAKIEFINTITS